MSETLYADAVKDVIYLVSCAVNEIIPDRNRVDLMNIDLVYQIAKKQLLTAIISYALESSGYKSEVTSSEIAMSIRKTVIMEKEKEEVLQKMEDAGIWYMPLKGTVLKDYYPKTGMRQMADIDILFDSAKAEQLREIMLNQGFEPQVTAAKSPHDVYFKKPVTNFEMHKTLFGAMRAVSLYDYYIDVKNRLVLNERSSCGCHFTDEDFYVYLIAHEYKHFAGGGTGIRSLLDIYVFLKKFEQYLDWKYILAELGKLELTDFERKNRELSLKLFQLQDLDEEEENMLAYMVSSGVYGNIQNLVNNGINSAGGGKYAYILHRVFLPMEKIKRGYPLFYKFKILLPLLPIYRLIKSKNNPHAKSKAEWKELKKR